VQMKVLNSSVWLMRAAERVLPWHGTSLVIVAKKR
jgi:hypothetical protein